VAERSLRGEVGGEVVVDAGEGRTRRLRVGGPRRSRIGPVGRLRATLRVHLLRVAPRGAPPFGRTDAEAVALAREQVALANALWGQCGIGFGPPAEVQVRLVDPAPAHLLAVGCEVGTPATGGVVRFAVDGREVRLATEPGWRPSQVARKLARAVEQRGMRAHASPNSRIAPGALPSVDLLVLRRDGTPASIAPAGRAPLSTDAGLGVCIGSGALEAGLRHFLDVDSMAGTTEERALLKSIDDGDPATIDVVFVGAFARGGRIGESFIGNDRSSLRNLVIIDRAGVRVSRASFALAHELGHVLLDVPGHPDDFGVDTPTRLMDSDGADMSVFGPRRLTVAECERAIVQSGPGSPIPTLVPWPWAPRR
jgi:hypothetical protein